MSDEAGPTPPIDSEAPRQAAPALPRIPVGWSHAVVVTAAVWTLVVVLRAVVATAMADDLRQWWASGEPSAPAIDLIGVLDVLMGLMQLAAFVVAGLWLYLVATAVRRLRPDAWHRRADYWAFLGWIVPVVNFWFPYQVVEDVARAVGSATRTLVPWWLAWLVIMLVAPGYEAFVASGMESVGDVDAWVLAMQVHAATTVVAGALWVHVVRSVTRAAQATAG